MPDRPTDTQYNELRRMPITHAEVMRGGRRRRTRLALMRRRWVEFRGDLLVVTAAGERAMELYKATPKPKWRKKP